MTADSPLPERAGLDPRRIPGQAALRIFFRALSATSPATAAQLAEALLVRTPRPRLRKEEEAFLDRASAFSVTAAGERIAGYRWGESGPLVLCIHGWGSSAGRFFPLATTLLERGAQVVAFDAAGHGRSTGWRSSMPEFVASLTAVIERVGPVRALVGHSLGGSAAIFATSQGIAPKRIVTLGAPANLAAWADQVAEALELPDAIYARLRANMEQRLKLSWSQLQIPDAAQTLTLPGLVLHDRDDSDVPWSDAERIAEAWRGATLRQTEGLGHRAIIRDPEVIQQVVAFVLAEE